ncbi:phosphatidylglycerophosphate synthase [Kocuria dechangensis]|uniref:Phosphatidylglycerophosphate synthase n=1 Tax=Kocuria dechangensis TaxID=1176249 RepID=A0A917LSM4_9MICC|nr:CDP-alcohol phosphatidyltransferase family protein [Kocuria dechangensis]GGG53334.1 phosphatidylglycerophosphate synthase [Kocuria dechangensis]
MEGQDTVDPQESPYYHRVLTLPNVVSVARFCLIVPAVLAVLHIYDHPVRALVLVAVFSLTDWVDGVLARALNQRSRVGEVMDPIADRLGTMAIAVAAAAVGLFPWWVIIAIVVVDVVIGIAALRHRTFGVLRVTRVGKAKTALLMVGSVLVLAGPAWNSTEVTVSGRVLVQVAAVLHLVAGVQYFRQVTRRD